MGEIIRYESGKVYIPPDKVNEAKSVGLYDYFVYKGVGLKRKGREYCTEEHDSLCLSTDGKWNWFSQGVGGRNAVDFLMKTEGYSFQDAILEILDSPIHEMIRNNVQGKTDIDSRPTGISAEKAKSIVLPERDTDNTKITEYLVRRGIDREVIDYFIEQGTLYQDRKYKSVVFIGTDKNGNARLANIRGITSSFKQTTAGSDRAYGFNHFCEATVYGNDTSKGLHVFEAPIDLLSYASIIKIGGYDFRKFNYLSLSGIYASRDNPEETKIPVCLTKTFEDYPAIHTLFLHLDNDGPGMNAAKALQMVIKDKRVEIEPPPQGFKDVNDYLVSLDDQVKSNVREI